MRQYYKIYIEYIENLSKYVCIGLQRKITRYL
jgi:hypothetical protein